MTSSLMATAEALEQTISESSTEKRLELQPQFSQVIADLISEGTQVPLRMKRLEAALTDEAVEAKFDNMPV